MIYAVMIISAILMFIILREGENKPEVPPTQWKGWHDDDTK